MGRLLKNWLTSYLEYTEGTEAPRIMHFWCGVSVLAGALRKRVWIDMKRFKWTPNFFIILVAPPGIIAKTTTMDIGMDLLKRIPSVKFGPDVVTWQALVQIFAQSGEMFQYGEDFIPMSAVTIASGELGNLINPLDKDMVNLYISLWDGKVSFEKITKGSGNDTISAPWINMIGCTTPHWIADNMPAATVGGGFTSRCVFVYGDKKEHFIAYPDESARPDLAARADELVADLEHISTNLIGPFTIPEETRKWGREWYQTLWSKGYEAYTDDQLKGYLARKQTHMHKLAMILSAARDDSQIILPDDLRLAELMLTSTEKDAEKVFAKIGRTEDSLQAERLLAYIERRGTVPYQTAYKYIYTYFPDFRDFEGIVAGLIRSGQVKFDISGDGDPTKGLLVFIPGK